MEDARLATAYDPKGFFFLFCDYNFNCITLPAFAYGRRILSKKVRIHVGGQERFEWTWQAKRKLIFVQAAAWVLGCIVLRARGTQEGDSAVLLQRGKGAQGKLRPEEKRRQGKAGDQKRGRNQKS